MDFSLSDEHRLVEQSVREWGAREVAPRIHDLDRAHEFDCSLLSQMASLGLLGIAFQRFWHQLGLTILALLPSS
jgi:alkylation response protein AidB-like acyl-CoA dehydrogenase